ncbi:MAG: hypothetical protein KF704_01875 [Crocinitomicaceae bacterium]|nr:hypothetical protein [Crocinitomicaceae bacterium]
METMRGKGLSPEKVIRILDKHGTKVNLEEAKLILGFMNKLVYVTINDYFRREKSLMAKESLKKIG